MNHALTVSAFALLASATAFAETETEPAWVEEARGGASALGSQLQQALQSAIRDGGPVAGIDVCKHQAPAIADKVSSERIEVGRTALKLRNPDNRPDAWERQVLIDFKRRLAAGESPGRIETFAVRNQGDQRVGHWMKAIPTQGMCTVCHGQAIAPDVAAAIDAAYPEDEARGFAEGDLRGAFTVRVELDE
jgi:hypothetical protein